MPIYKERKLWNEEMETLSREALRALQLADSNVFAGRLGVMKGLESLAGGKGNFSIVAEQFLKIGVQQTLYWIYNWTADIIRLLSSGSERGMVNRDMREYLVQFASNVGLQAAHDYLRYLNDGLRLVERQLNPQLLMENILMTWQETFLRAR